MYTGTDPSLQDLQAQITALKGRLNVVDGQGLVDPTQGVLFQLNLKYQGLRSDLKQSVMMLEQILKSYKETVGDFMTLLKSHLGIS